MVKSSTASVKITPKMREEIKRYGIKPSEVMRRALEEEIQRRKIQEIKQRLETVAEQLDSVDIDEETRSMREDRDRR